MGRKIRAAQTSLVAAFVAAGGAAAAGAVPGKSAQPARHTATVTFINWGDPLIRFWKLDGFSSYFKYDGFAQLAQYYKVSLLRDAATMYDKWRPQVSDLLDLYHKAGAGPLAGILIGLETFYKEDGNVKPLLDYLKTPGAMDAFVKFEKFFSALQTVSREDGNDAFSFFVKMTGIAGNPLQSTDTVGQLG